MRRPNPLTSPRPGPGDGRAPIRLIRPTQATVGFAEVAAKRRRYRAAWSAGVHGEILERAFPVVVGPEGELYALDGHHWMRALAEEGVETVRVAVVGDFRRLTGEAFWAALEARGWCHPYDGEGTRIAFDRIPHAIADLADDPFRSLATALRRTGAVAKSRGLFSEFGCAACLRERIPAAVARRNGPAALRAAVPSLAPPPGRRGVGCGWRPLPRDEVRGERAG
jgi:hypothetical protein